jgi:hypothetical protein
MRLSRSDAVRQWIRLADADARAQATKPAPPADPRQMEVTDLLDKHG